MFGRIRERAQRQAERRAAAGRERLAARMRSAAPGEIEVGVEGETVVLGGRGLSRRLLVDPALRWLVAESKNER